MRSIRQFVASYCLLPMLLVVGFVFVSCTTAPQSQAEQRALTTDTAAFLVRAKETDPSLGNFFENSVGYAAIPEIGKGGMVLGAAYGQGQLFNGDGSLIGYCDVRQGSVGAQIGGQIYGELIFFETQAAMDKFQKGQYALAAHLSAVALTAGAGGAGKYQDGVALFIVRPRGLMAEASVGGQRFSYQSLADASKIAR